MQGAKLRYNKLKLSEAQSYMLRWESTSRFMYSLSSPVM